MIATLFASPPPPLPESLAPPAPFPIVTAQSFDSEFVAPGVRRGSYRVQTTDGPLVITVVAIDPHEPTVRFSSVVANDRLVSPGETVSSMARRTGAVAGVNADYFDIGQTNQPLNLVVRAGALLRTPSKRIVLDVRTDRSIAFENVSFSGTVSYGATTIPLTGVNEWPPQGGATLLTPAYGVPKPNPDVSIVQLVPVDEAHLATDLSGTYRVAAARFGAGNVAGVLLGFGPAARALGPLPSEGDTLHLDVTTSPSLPAIANAVGGGPLLVAAGAPAVDPNAPAPEERDRHFPVSGAALTATGELLLVAVDGRSASSVGVTRPQFAALMLGLGATSAMAFDSGGSATVVARVLGENAASVLNTPSDGEERAVADGLFVYSDAAVGPPARLVVRPARVVALPETVVAVSLAVVDAAGHLIASPGPAAAIVRVARTSRIATLRSGSTTAAVPVDVVTRLARLEIAPAVRDPDPGALVTFVARGFDASGRLVALGDRVRWSSDRGRFGAAASYVAPARNARIVAIAAGARAETTLLVGRHRSAIALSDRPSLSLAYDFTSGARAAYAPTNDVPLPGEPQSFTVEIEGDRSGVGVRAAFVNVLGERRALTLARAVDWTGWRAVTIPLPDDLNPPVHLVSLYAVDSLANAASHAAGTLAFRNASTIVAGTP